MQPAGELELEGDGELELEGDGVAEDPGGDGELATTTCRNAHGVSLSLSPWRKAHGLR